MKRQLTGSTSRKQLSSAAPATTVENQGRVMKPRRLSVVSQPWVRVRRPLERAQVAQAHILGADGALARPLVRRMLSGHVLDLVRVRVTVRVRVRVR
eukprot:scaffold38339_cov62-Phaeocystis_antarctica.AAC.3